MKTKKHDFVELDFSAYTKEGLLFDTTRQEDAKRAGIEKGHFEPIVVCIGEGMVLKSLDKALENKEVGKDYELVLKPEEAFGKRIPQLIKTFPISAFTEKPIPGMFVDVNGIVGKVISVTSGRVVVDLNNPLAGKEVIYKFRINRIINENKKKIEAIAKIFNLEIKDIEEKEGKVIISLKNKNISIEAFKKKVKELVGVDTEIIDKEKENANS